MRLEQSQGLKILFRIPTKKGAGSSIPDRAPLAYAIQRGNDFFFRLVLFQHGRDSTIVGSQLVVNYRAIDHLQRLRKIRFA